MLQPPSPARKVTRAEFERFIDLPENSQRRFELINGEIVEREMTFLRGMIIGNMVTAVHLFLLASRLGRIVIGVRHGLQEDDGYEVQPAASYISDRSREVLNTSPLPYMPDLAIEVKSSDDKLRKLREKARYYLAHGTKVVWIAIPELKVVEVYTADEELVLGIGDTLTGGDVLPGFTMPVANAFEL